MFGARFAYSPVVPCDKEQGKTLWDGQTCSPWMASVFPQICPGFGQVGFFCLACRGEEAGSDEDAEHF